MYSYINLKYKASNFCEYIKSTDGATVLEYGAIAYNYNQQSLQKLFHKIGQANDLVKVIQ